MVTDEQSGLGGAIWFNSASGAQALPWTRLDVGSPVLLSPDAREAEQSHRGVICQRNEQSICVALDRLPEELGEHPAWRLDLSFDEASVKRQREGLERARAARGDRTAVLRDVSWTGASRNSGLIPRSARWTAVSMPSRSRRCNLPSQPAMWR